MTTTREGWSSIAHPTTPEPVMSVSTVMVIRVRLLIIHRLNTVTVITTFVWHMFGARILAEVK